MIYLYGKRCSFAQNEGRVSKIKRHGALVYSTLKIYIYENVQIETDNHIL